MRVRMYTHKRWIERQTGSVVQRASTVESARDSRGFYEHASIDGSQAFLRANGNRMFSTRRSLSVARLAILPCLLLTYRRPNSRNVVDLTIDKRPRESLRARWNSECWREEPVNENVVNSNVRYSAWTSTRYCSHGVEFVREEFSRRTEIHFFTKLLPYVTFSQFVQTIAIHYVSSTRLHLDCLKSLLMNNVQ